MGTTEIEVAVAGESDRAAWTEFCERSPGAEAGHRWEFHDGLHEVFKTTALRLYARQGEQWLGLVPLLFQESFVGRFLTSVPYLNYAGVLGADPGARRALCEEARAAAARLNADRLEIRGRDGSDLPIEAWSGKAGYSLDLPAEASILWGALGPKLRAQIKRPTKEGYEAMVAGKDGLERFYPLLARKWHELGSPVLPVTFFEMLGRVFGDDLEYVLVQKAQSVAAGGVLLRHAGRIEIPWASSAAEHDRYGVNMMLYWSALERAVQRGATTFDFGRSSPGTGTARFKLQWGARETPLTWNVQVRDGRGRAGEQGDGRRKLVAALWRRLPRFVASRLGPAFAARIPY